MARSFYENFRFAMNSAGLPAPEQLFSSAQTAIGTITTLVGAVKTFGTGVTLAEIIGAGSASDLLLAAGAILASYYAGAAVGALLYAIGEWTSDLFSSTTAPATSEIIAAASSAGITIPPAIALMTRTAAPRMVAA